MPNSSIKDEKLYEELRDEGNSKEKAARISNAAAAGDVRMWADRAASPDPMTTGRSTICASERKSLVSRAIPTRTRVN